MNNIILVAVFFVSSHISAQLSLWSNFEDGTLEEWTNTDTSETLLSVQNDVDFWFLQKACDGSNSPVGEMAIINTGEEWAGNHWYEAGGGETTLVFVNDIRMRNTNNYDLHVRIGITGSNGYQVVTTTPLIIPALSDWTSYEGPQYEVNWLGLSNLTVLNDTGGIPPLEVYSNVIDMFSDVVEYRLIHNSTIAYNGEVVNGFLEIDEMYPLWLLSTNETKSNNVALLPNPTQGLLFINNSNKMEISSVRVYDVTGKLVLSKKGNVGHVDVSHVDTGILIVEIETENGTVTKKIMKR